MTTLSAGTLTTLDPSVAVPTYDRSTVTSGIVHVGVGGFHRAHQAMYLDRLMGVGLATSWGITGAGVRSTDVAMRDALVAQDGLYTLVLRHPDGAWTPRVIGSIVDYLLRADGPEALLERMAAPEVRIVSLTITEGGYGVDPLTGEFDAQSPAVQSDLRGDGPPGTVFGVVVEALARRRARGIPPFTVLSCDNIQKNGVVARSAFAGFARLRGDDLGAWVADEVRFPSSMVDRITPQTTDDDRVEVRRRFGVDDRWPVLCEPFCQWVLEDDFGAGRPPLEEVGVQLVADVEPYEQMKLRLLNAGHQALGHAGRLAGLELVHEVAHDPVFERFLLEYMRQEAIPTLPPVPGVDLTSYTLELVERFSNTEIRDTVSRLCANASDRVPAFLFPVLRHQIAAGGPLARATAVVACWARSADGPDERGHPVEIEDPLAGRLTAAASRQRREPLAFLSENRTVFGDLLDSRRFTETYAAILSALYEGGVRRTLTEIDGLATR